MHEPSNWTRLPGQDPTQTVCLRTGTRNSVSLEQHRRRLESAMIQSMDIAILRSPVDERALLPAQARSKEAYALSETEDKEAIIRVATFHRKEFDIALITFGARSSSLIRSLLREPFPSTPTASLGFLDRLPVEVVCQIIRCFDVASLLRFRQANRRARQLMTTLPEYRVVTEYAMDSVLALYKTSIASHFTLTDILAALGTENCPLCGQFGGFVFLLAFRRCCFACLGAPELAVYQARTITNKRLQNVPVLRSIPGRYGLVETIVENRSWLTTKKPSNASRSAWFHGYLSATALPYADLHSRAPRVQRGLCCNGCQISAGKDRWMHGDLEGYGIRHLRNRVYSRDGYLEHFRWCREAQALWKASRGGTLPVEVPGEAVWGMRLPLLKYRDNDDE
ncbi:hypothetical protein VTI74DRAFT_2048 [Chaetomium olivicolor]